MKIETKTEENTLTLKQGVYLSLQIILSDFLTDRQLRGARPATLQSYKCEINLFVRWACEMGVRDLTDITSDLLRMYLLSLGERRKRTGVFDAFRVLRIWLKWSWAEYDLAGICPIQKVRVAAPSIEAKPGIPLETCEKLLKACICQRDKTLILFLLDTGIRRKELTMLTVGDVVGDVVTLQADGTKTGKARAAFLSLDTKKALRAYLRERGELADNAPLFSTANGSQLSINGLRQIIRRACIRAGVAQTGLHGFRRTFALESLRAGADVVSVSRLLGHTRIETTKRYLAQTNDDLAEVHKLTSPVNKLIYRFSLDKFI